MSADVRVFESGGLEQEAAPHAEARQESEAVDDKPRSVYEVLTRQMLEQVKADVKEVKDRVNTLIWLVVGAMLLELAMRVVK